MEVPSGSASVVDEPVYAVATPFTKSTVSTALSRLSEASRLMSAVDWLSQPL